MIESEFDQHLIGHLKAIQCKSSTKLSSRINLNISREELDWIIYVLNLESKKTVTSTESNQDCIIVTKPDDSKRIVKIIYDKKLEGYRFVNLTEGKEHICTCVFNTEEEAMNDLEDHIKRGLVKSYKKIKINFAQLLVD